MDVSEPVRILATSAPVGPPVPRLLNGSFITTILSACLTLSLSLSLLKSAPINLLLAVNKTDSIQRGSEWQQRRQVHHTHTNTHSSISLHPPLHPSGQSIHPAHSCTEIDWWRAGELCWEMTTVPLTQTHTQTHTYSVYACIVDSSCDFDVYMLNQ